MPNFTTDTYTNQIGAAGTSPALSYPLARTVGGKLRYILVPYTCDGAEAAADTIQICKLKAGAVVVPNLCRIISEAAFDCDDVNIGDGVNANRFADALDTTNALLDQPFVGGDEHFAPPLWRMERKS